MASNPSDLEDVLQAGYRYALALGHDRHLAEDLLQDAAVAISRRGGPWNEQYLMTTIRNKFIDQCRRKKVLAFVDLDMDIQSADSESPAVDGLEEAMAALKPSEREMLYLSAVTECSASEISELTGRPRGSVLSMIHRAKEKVRRMLRGSGSPL